MIEIIFRKSKTINGRYTKDVDYRGLQDINSIDAKTYEVRYIVYI